MIHLLDRFSLIYSDKNKSMSEYNMKLVQMNEGDKYMNTMMLVL